MAESDSRFTVVAAFYENVILQKEAEERAREDDLHLEPIRRR